MIMFSCQNAPSWSAHCYFHFTDVETGGWGGQVNLRTCPGAGTRPGSDSLFTVPSHRVHPGSGLENCESFYKYHKIGSIESPQMSKE